MTEKVITVCLVTGNELPDIQRTIDSIIRFADEFLVFDNSTDGTIGIAEQYATQVIPYESGRILDGAAWSNQCLGMVKTPWAWIISPPYYLRADRDPAELKQALLNCPEHALWLANWRGDEGTLWPDYQTDVVRPGQGQFVRPIHTQFNPLPRAVLDRVTKICPSRTGWGEKERKERQILYSIISPEIDAQHRANMQSWTRDPDNHPNKIIERTAPRY